ncbi:histone-lysine N-methyltransferase PRDM9-like [Eupeodes corollae]|uniref:histone-lysine N-methyltransferase PRDM9-like n=1 Tax=Eupeodes corollae TaxID=290404 RepID=UPI002490C9D1|nr:histone-lysine N-methyltransferase PRDM9-like [Eupeodes corollae]
MTHTKTDIISNKLQLEFNPLKLTKCGEIQINDWCTNAYIFCAFCCDDGDPDNKYFTTLQEFIDHIRWHRSESDDRGDLNSPILQNGIGNIGFDGLEDDAPPIQEPEFLTDWIAPPEELFASNTITNFIEMEPHPHESELVGVNKPEVEQQGNEKNTPMSKPTQVEEDVSELTGEVFIELLDLYKKCPCVWHERIASTTNSDIIDGVYKLLTAHFNKYAQQSKPVDYVRRILIQVKNCFLEEYKDLKQTTEADSLPWYYPYLSFILNCDSVDLDKSIFTDFICPICTLDLSSQEDLWNHLMKFHIELAKPKEIDNSDDVNKPPSNKYPAEVVDKFIDLYRSQTCLWDKTNKEYYSRLMRRKSYDLLLDILHEHDPEANHAEVGRRINYLNAELASTKKDVITSENCLSIPDEQIELFMENISVKKNRNPPPQLKVRPCNFRKKIRSGKCPICATSFSDHAAWLTHMESTHTSEDFQSKDGFFYCTVCGWQNKTKKLLMRHLRNKHTNNLRRCTDCNLGFRLLSQLVDHRAKVHNDFNPFKCETCGDGFPSRSALRTHATTHLSTEERSTWCVDCGTKFADMKSYRAHIRRHKLDKKEMLCKFCQKKWPTLADLRKHMRTHLSSSSVAHKCDKCGKGFTSPQLLKKHLNETHNVTNSSIHINRNTVKKQIYTSKICRQNQSRVSCDDCGAKFFRKTSLRKHKRLKHDRTACAS